VQPTSSAYSFIASKHAFAVPVPLSFGIVCRIKESFAVCSTAQQPITPLSARTTNTAPEAKLRSKPRRNHSEFKQGVSALAHFNSLGQSLTNSINDATGVTVHITDFSN